MKTFVFVLSLMLAATMVAQNPRSQAPPSSQSQQASPSQQMPPDQSAAGAGAQVQQQIEQSWQSASDLSGAKLHAQASGDSVTLSGVVASEDQHQKAVQVATQNAGGLKIVDKIKVKQ